MTIETPVLDETTKETKKREAPLRKDEDKKLPINAQLRKLRKARGWKATEVAKHLGVKAYTYRGYEAEVEADNFRIPSLSQLVKLSRLYNVSVGYILGMESEKTQHKAK